MLLSVWGRIEFSAVTRPFLSLSLFIISMMYDVEPHHAHAEEEKLLDRRFGRQQSDSIN